MKNILFTVALFATIILCAQHSDHNNGAWTSARPDGHAPISVMGDHMHHKGELMFSYRYMNMQMEGLRSGSDEATLDQAHQLYGVVPLSMPMDMHMLGAMYAPSDRITLMAMAMYTDLSMDLNMRMPNGMTRQFETAASGFGDVKVAALIKLLNQDRQGLHMQVGLSIPTGAIDAMDETPMSAPNEVILPYPMQIGSGTLDTDWAVTYLGQCDLFSWGSQLKSTFRLGRNDNDYALGNQYRWNNWFAVKASDWLSFSTKLESLVIDDIRGANPALNPMMVMTADATNYGGNLLNGGLGINLLMPSGALKGLRLGAEFIYPLFQDLDGIQLERAETIVLGLQYALH